ncbi:hypothetical protein ScPMuIL_017343 [Solemya velum]
MKVAVEGCCHGELDKIYETLEYLQKKNNVKVDLLIICGDFQAVRNLSDMECMAVPKKYQKMNTFYKYYSGEKTAPILTIFVGGNHEASNYLQELPYGGWVAPNIFYMGYACVIKFGGLRIAGLSGIFKNKDFLKGHHEHPPYSEDTKRSAYHVRNLEIFRMKQISRPIDICISHDWPRGIYNYGNMAELLRVKKHFRDEVENNILGSPASAELLHKLKPDYWFAAHLHVKFAAIVKHQPEDGVQKMTKFLSLDKCLPRRKFLQVIDIPHDSSALMKLQLDPEWLAIVKSTNHLLSLSPKQRYMPGPGSNERWDFRVKDEEMNAVLEDFGGDLTYPESFERSVTPYDPSSTVTKSVTARTMVNSQTKLLCTMLDITDPNAVFLGLDSQYNLKTNAQLEDVDMEDNDTDELDDDETDYESEPSFISVSGSERSFSFQDESFTSVGNPNEISLSEADTDSVEALEKSSMNTENSSASEEDKEPKDSPSAVSKNEDEEELREILAAQKRERSSIKTNSPTQSTNHDKSNLNNEENELQEILAEQQKLRSSVSELTGELAEPLSHSSPASDERVERNLAPLERHIDRKDSTGQSPLLKRFKRRNLDLYSDSTEESS